MSLSRSRWGGRALPRRERVCLGGLCSEPRAGLRPAPAGRSGAGPPGAGPPREEVVASLSMEGPRGTSARPVSTPWSASLSAEVAGRGRECIWGRWRSPSSERLARPGARTRRWTRCGSSHRGRRRRCLQLPSAAACAREWVLLGVGGLSSAARAEQASRGFVSAESRQAQCRRAVQAGVPQTRWPSVRSGPGTADAAVTA